MAFGEGIRGVWVCVWLCACNVIHSYQSMLLNSHLVEEKNVLHVHLRLTVRETACSHTHIRFLECVFVFLCVTVALALALIKCMYVCEWVCIPECGCMGSQVCTKLDRVTVACVPVCYHGDSKWPFKRCPSAWWDQITSMKGKSRNKQRGEQGNEYIGGMQGGGTGQATC